MTTLAHWLNNDETMSPWLGIDDSDRVSGMAELVGCAFLSVLDVIDHAKELKPNSAYRDLGLVMSLYLKWTQDLAVDFDGDEEWREHVVAYAKKGGIDLKASGCRGIAESLEELEDVEALQNNAVGRWKWTSKVSILHQCGFLTIATLPDMSQTVQRVQTRVRLRHFLDSLRLALLRHNQMAS